MALDGSCGRERPTTAYFVVATHTLPNRPNTDGGMHVARRRLEYWLATPDDSNARVVLKASQIAKNFEGSSRA